MCRSSAILPSKGWWAHLNPGPFNIKGTPIPLDVLRPIDLYFRRTCYRSGDVFNGFQCCRRYGGYRSSRSVSHVSDSDVSHCLRVDLFYDLRLNAAMAIFQIFATQMIGYGIAGLRESSHASMTLVSGQLTVPYAQCVSSSCTPHSMFLAFSRSSLR